MEKIKLLEFTIEKIKNREFEKVIPELYELENVIQNNPWHDNDPVFNHTLSVVTELNNLLETGSDKIKEYLNKKVKNNSRRQLLILAAIFHDIAKKEAVNEALFLGHEEMGAGKFRDIILRFNLSQGEKYFTEKIIRNHGFIHEILFHPEENPNQKWLKFKEKNPDIFLEIALLSKADMLGSQLKNNMPEDFDFRMDFINKIIESY
jgi:hypothetical protein